MQHRVTIGPAPSGESCAYEGAADVARANEREARVFQRMLKRMFPTPAGTKARITVKCAQGDCGPYRQVCVVHNGSAEGEAFARDVQRRSPSRWDERAVAELAWYSQQSRYSELVRSGAMREMDVPQQYRGLFPPDALPPAAQILRPSSRERQVLIDPGFTILIGDTVCRLVCIRAHSGHIKLALVDHGSGEPYANVTVVLPDAVYVLAADEVFVKTWFENEHLVQPLLNSGLFEDTGIRERAGRATAQVWRLTPLFVATFGTYDLRRAA